MCEPNHNCCHAHGIEATHTPAATWAVDAGTTETGDQQMLRVAIRPGAVQMADSAATGTGLVSNGRIGADIISLRAGQRFAPHTHPGDHVLIIIGGFGTLALNGTIHPTQAGQVFIVDGEHPHAVGAITDHQILAIGSPHKPVDAPDRMTLVEYRAVLSAAGEMHCTICKVSTTGAAISLHDEGCLHCPCTSCC